MEIIQLCAQGRGQEPRKQLKWKALQQQSAAFSGYYLLQICLSQTFSGVVETLLVRLIQREPRLVSLSPRNIEIVSFKHCEKKTISFEGISPFPPLKCCSIQRHDKQRCEIALKAHKTRQLRQLRTISGNRNNKNVHRQNMVTEHITELQCYRLHTAQKVSAFGVILLRIFPHSD